MRRRYLALVSHLLEIFRDEKLVEKIKLRLPYLFQLAEVENARAGKIGMEVGSTRERIIIALLIYKFGEENVGTNIPITESDVDVRVFGFPVSTKTATSKSLSGVKLMWTVDSNKAREFYETYYPKSGLLFTQVVWNDTGGFYYIPIEVQQSVFSEIGRNEYIRLPKPGTNPRGIELTRKALERLVKDSNTEKIMIYWERKEIKINPYKRWLDLWMES